MPMRFYNATAFMFPRRYEWRMLLICFLAVHVPLIAAITFQAVTGEWQPMTLLVLLVATLIGTGLGLAAIRGLLAPVVQATSMLRAIQAGKPVKQVPVGQDDLVGQLLKGVATAANESAARITALADAAERDPLTGIRNRRGFMETARAILSGNANAVIAIIDLDHFKLVNDKFGHATGDRLLQDIAKALEADLRRTDVTARWGGEEFVVLMPGTLLDEARLVLERLRAGIALDTGLLGDNWPVTFSCGLAPVRNFGELGDATRKADEALYKAKNGGRNRVMVSED